MVPMRRVIESSCDLLPREIGCALPPDHDDLRPGLQGATLAPKPLADAALDAIPNHGIADLAAHRDAQTRLEGVRGPAACRGENEHDECSRRRATTALENISELPGSKQPVLPAKRSGRPGHRYFEGVETARRLRPFARRRLSTARPAFVFMRDRKPWTRLRRIRLG